MRLLHTFVLLPLCLASGCTAEHTADGPRTTASAPEPAATAPSNAANAPNAWCAALPALTADSSGDLTGKTNTEARVQQVRAAHQLDSVLWRCPGVVGVGMSSAEIREHIASGTLDAWARSKRKPFTSDDPEWVLSVMIEKPEYMPKQNPLYLDGVRVYFEVTGRIEPL